MSTPCSFDPLGPADPEYFVGRDKLINDILEWPIVNKQIICEADMGATSLLKYVEARGTDLLRERGSGKALFVYLNCKEVVPLSSQRFWQKALGKTKEKCRPFADICEHISKVESKKIEPDDLKELGETFNKHEVKLVFLIDEFTSVVTAQMAEFLDQDLYTVATHRAFAIVVAIPTLLSKLYEDRKIPQIATPLWQKLSPHYLGLLEEEEVNELIKSLENIMDVQLSLEDYKHIRQHAGRHPKLVRMASKYVCEAIANGLKGEQRYKFLEKELYDRNREFFRCLWKHRDEREREFLGKLALYEIGELRTSRYKYNFSQVDELLSNFKPEREELGKRGLVDEKGEIKTFAPSFSKWIVNEELMRKANKYGWLSQCRQPLSKGEVIINYLRPIIPWIKELLPFLVQCIKKFLRLE